MASATLIQDDKVWSEPFYILSQDVTVFPTKTLTIRADPERSEEPVRVRFGSGVTIRMQAGSRLVLDHVEFTGDGGRGVEFVTQDETSTAQVTRLRCHGGMDRCFRSFATTFLIQDSVFQDVTSTAVEEWASIPIHETAIVQNSLFWGNRAGVSGPVLLRDCVLANNEWAVDWESNADVESSIFMNNQHGGGHYSLGRIQDVMFFQNDVGIQGLFGQLQNVTFLQNQIAIESAYGDMDQGSLERVNFIDSADAHISYQATETWNIPNMYWGDTQVDTIRLLIYDIFQISNVGLVNIEPIATTFWNHSQFPEISENEGLFWSPPTTFLGFDLTSLASEQPEEDNDGIFPTASPTVTFQTHTTQQPQQRTVFPTIAPAMTSKGSSTTHADHEDSASTNSNIGMQMSMNSNSGKKSGFLTEPMAYGLYASLLFNLVFLGVIYRLLHRNAKNDNANNEATGSRESSKYHLHAESTIPQEMAPLTDQTPLSSPEQKIMLGDGSNQHQGNEDTESPTNAADVVMAGSLLSSAPKKGPSSVIISPPAPQIQDIEEAMMIPDSLNENSSCENSTTIDMDVEESVSYLNSSSPLLNSNLPPPPPMSNILDDEKEEDDEEGFGNGVTAGDKQGMTSRIADTENETTWVSARNNNVEEDENGAFEVVNMNANAVENQEVLHEEDTLHNEIKMGSDREMGSEQDEVKKVA